MGGINTKGKFVHFTKDESSETLPYEHNNNVIFFVGALMLAGSLDYDTTPSYVLVIDVSDGGIDGDNVLTSTAAISITVIDTSEYVLRFDNGGVYNVSVMEETTQDNIVTVNINTFIEDRH